MVKVLPESPDLDLIFLIDKSGSMYGSEEDIIGGFNSFIAREKSKEFNTKVTTIFFDHEYEVLYKRKSIKDVDDLTHADYQVRGSTALFDAIGRTIVNFKNEISNKVLFVIMTDGMENSSVEFSKSQITDMIENQGWEFIYIGADINSYREAEKIGIRKSRTANYQKSKEGIDRLYCSVESAADSIRANKSLDEANWKKDLKRYD
ncbi:vWA domain-containing protein [Methanobrevibacter sp.]|uniref:vWA domain-containing protein n=1 Tax=Methanobrevibacter sp. TaxID=66852 RepID=UPI0025EEF111|nr:vWA domain-containing protein [Methanobrevibacter sp.]MBQ2831945.1 VWA domain-containing protein [Methanobrevibacter sp.]